MNIKIIAFGIARDIIGGNQATLDCNKGTTVSQAFVHLTEKYPDFEKLSSLKMAINEEYVPNDFVISEGDELVLIPPVSGG